MLILLDSLLQERRMSGGEARENSWLDGGSLEALEI